MSLNYHILRTHSRTCQVDEAERLLVACIDCACARVTIKAILHAGGLPIPLDPD